MYDRKELPTGLGAEELQKNRETLPAVEVANEVIWVNPSFKDTLPFDIKKGESTKLGMFLSEKPDEDDRSYNLEVKAMHGRSGILGRVIFKDAEGHLYRDVDVKGIGYVEQVSNTISVGDVRRDDRKVEHIKGVLDVGCANHDRYMAERFIAWGIRTYRPIAIVELKELIFTNGEKVSVEAAREAGTLKNRELPVEEIRAWGTRSRIGDATDKTVEDARRLVAQEIGADPEKFHLKEYFKWLIRAVAVGIARMHFQGLVHTYMTQHNITLDGRIVDLDSVKPLVKAVQTYPNYGYASDLQTAENTLSWLLYKFGYNDDLLTKPFNLAYNEELEQLKKYNKDK